MMSLGLTATSHASDGIGASFMGARKERPDAKSRGNATAKRSTSLRRAALWKVIGPSRAGAIKFAQSRSGDYSNLRGVFGRRRSNTDRNEY